MDEKLEKDLLDKRKKVFNDAIDQFKESNFSVALKLFEEVLDCSQEDSYDYDEGVRWIALCQRSLQNQDNSDSWATKKEISSWNHVVDQEGSKTNGSFFVEEFETLKEKEEMDVENELKHALSFVNDSPSDLTFAVTEEDQASWDTASHVFSESRSGSRKNSEGKNDISLEPQCHLCKNTSGTKKFCPECCSTGEEEGLKKRNIIC